MLILNAFVRLQTYLLSLLAALAAPAGDGSPALADPHDELGAPDPNDLTNPLNAPPAADHASRPLAVDDDLFTPYAGTCTCSSFLGIGCEVQTDHCSQGFHPECHCSFFGGNSCACKPN